MLHPGTFLACVFYLYSLQGRTGATVGAHLARFVDTQHKFSFEPPAGWEAKTHPEAVVVYMEPTAFTQTRPKHETAKELIARLNKKLQEPSAAGSFRCNITVTARD